MIMLPRALSRRPRLLAAIATGALVAFVLPVMDWTTRALLAWDSAIVVHLGLLVVMMARSDQEGLHRRADKEDAGAAMVLALTVGGAVASLAAIALELRGMRGEGGPAPLGRMLVAGATILFSWLYVHTMFAVHYAHDYHSERFGRGGLKFPGRDEPGYFDFMYFAFNLGAAAQTSDVIIEDARIRRFVLAHTILSFLFNTTVLALAINVGAGLL